MYTENNVRTNLHEYICRMYSNLCRLTLNEQSHNVEHLQSFTNIYYYIEYVQLVMSADADSIYTILSLVYVTKNL